MQGVLVGNDTPDTMSEKPIDIIMLQRIDEEQKATASRVEAVDKSLQRLGREVSEIRGGIGLLAETPAWIRFFVYPLCVLTAGSLVAAVITLVVKVNGIETFIHDNGGFIAGLRLQKNASSPASAQNIQEAKQLLTKAKAAKINIPPEYVIDAGKRFVEAVQENPDAWGAALALVDYRTFLNAGYSPKLEAVGPPAEKHQFSITIKPNPDFPQGPTVRSLRILTAGGYAPPEDSARIETLDNPNVPGTGSRYLIIEGGVGIILLDGEHFKNVIVRNAFVEYDGGPVRFENVSFVNCKFRLASQPNGQRLANAILESPAVTLTAKAA